MKKITSPTWIVLDFIEQGGASRIIQDFIRTNKKSFNSIFLFSGKTKVFAQKDIGEFKNSVTFPVDFYHSNLKTFFLIACKAFIKAFKIPIKNFQQSPVFVLNMPFSGLGIVCNPKLFDFKKLYIFHGALDKELFSRHANASNASTLSKWNYFKLNFTTKVAYLVQKFVMKKSDKVLVFSEYSYKLAAEYFLVDENKIFLTKIPLDADFLENQIIKSKLKQSIRDKYLPNKAKKTFLIYVPSRIEPRKGIRLTLEAILKVINDIDQNEVTLKFLFSGPVLDVDYALQLFLFCKQHNLFSVVEFIDPLKREDVYKLYQSSDLILMPSLDLETLGMITLESVSLGTPVMGFNRGGTREILANLSSKNLFLLKKVDANCLADGILNFVRTDAKIRNKIQNEVRKASKEFIFEDQSRVSLLESIAEISSASSH